MTYVIVHSGTLEEVAEHKTKKAATAQAKEMTAAHEGCLHNGNSIEFSVQEANPLAQPWTWDENS